MNNFSVLVVTDGTCGSTCATFLNHAIEVNAVTVIGVGGIQEDETKLVAASFAGGSVMDSQSFEDIFKELNVKPDSDADIPDRMPRDNYIRFPYNALMSFRDPTVAQEFVQYPVSYMVPYFQPIGLDVTNSIKDMLDFVVPRILAKDGENSPVNTKYNYYSVSCSDDSVNNARCGYFYGENQTFEDEPKVVGCEAGYYPVYEKDEKKHVMDLEVTSCEQLKETTVSTGDWSWIAIMFIIIAVVVCVLVLVFWIIRRKQGKAFGDTGFSKECCCPCCAHRVRLGVLDSDEMTNDRLGSEDTAFVEPGSSGQLLEG